MKLIRWNPAFDLLNVHSELDRVFGELMDGSGFNPRNGGGVDAPAFLPIDVRREGDVVVVEASVPGMDPGDVAVSFDGGALTISAGRAESEEVAGDYLRRERYVGRYHRQIALGEQVDGDKAQATFKNGVLAVTVPLVARPEPRRIPVQALEDN